MNGQKVTVVSKEVLERLRSRSSKPQVTPEAKSSPIPDVPTKIKLPITVGPKPLQLVAPLPKEDKIIIDRAQAAKEDDLIEIREANRLILGVKCHVIRTAQIAEKNELKQKLLQEDIKYDDILEQNRLKEIERASQEEKLKEESNQKHADFLKQQLQTRQEGDY